MKLLRHKISLFLACITAFTLAAQAGVKVGDEFPAFAEFKLEGKLPEALKGKVLLVDFWASWCAPCAKSFPVLDALQKTFKERGVVFVGVSVDAKADEMQEFLKASPVSFAIVRDAAHQLVERLEIEAMPTSFIVGRDGKVRFIHKGFHDDTKKKYAEEIESLLKGPL